MLYELPDGNRIVLDFYDRWNNIGIVFNTGHYAEVKEEHRNFRVFNQYRYMYSGGYGNLEVYKNLPNNILVLQETWYWYQKIKDNSGGNELNMNTAKEILRQDVRAFLKDAKIN